MGQFGFGGCRLAERNQPINHQGRATDLKNRSNAWSYDISHQTAERKRLSKEQKDVNGQPERLTKLLNSDLASRAPAQVVRKERDRLSDYQARAAKLREQIEQLG